MKKERSPIRIGPFPLALLAIGVVFIAWSLFQHFVASINAAGLRIVYPQSYNFSHYDQLLKKYVNEDGLVDYQALKKVDALSESVNELAKTSPDKLQSKLDKLAYWVNAFNLVSLKNIADHYPIERSTELKNSTSTQKFLVGGKPYSLMEIEEKELLPLIKETDWRGIFLMCNGTRGYPYLGNHAYLASTITNDMENACKYFVHDLSNYDYKPEFRSFSMSPFFRQYQQFIELKYKSPAYLLVEELDPDKKSKLSELSMNYGIPFDYRINDQALGPRPQVETP